MIGFQDSPPSGTEKSVASCHSALYLLLKLALLTLHMSRRSDRHFRTVTHKVFISSEGVSLKKSPSCLFTCLFILCNRSAEFQWVSQQLHRPCKTDKNFYGKNVHFKIQLNVISLDMLQMVFKLQWYCL